MTASTAGSVHWRRKLALLLLGFAAGWACSAGGHALVGAQSPAEVQALIDQAAAEYGLPEWARARAQRIAECESGWSSVPNRRGSGAYGIYQFMPRTWGWASWQAGWGGYGRDHVAANVYTAVDLFWRGQWSHWNASRHCWGGW